MLLKVQTAAQDREREQTGLDFNQPKHPITPEMEKETGLQALKDAPRFVVADSDGVERTIGDGSRPQFLLFILDGCPCSVDAQPIMTKLSKRFAGQIDFYGVIDAGVQKAKDWKRTYSVPFPIIPDPDVKIIHGYGAKHSVYNCVIKDGKIVKMWPGYSVDLMKDINATLAKAAGVPERPFDPEYAPKAKTSGCLFR